jgi:copper chaperone CopZ
LSEVEGVESVEVDVPAKSARVSMRPGTTLDRAACEQALKGTSYTVRSLEEVAAGGE